MRFEGRVRIGAARERVWDFLTDPHKVSECVPGVESLEVIAPRERFRAVASVGFGSVRARFSTDAEWLDLDGPNRARMKVHGTAPGSAVDAESEMLLRDHPEGGTELHWTADVSVLGAIASLAARLMGSVTQRLTSAFFDRVRDRIEARREFRFGPVSLEDAEGRILGHNVAGADGRLALRKGRILGAEDVALLRSLGRSGVYVAEPGDDDVGEDQAALRIAEAGLGLGLRLPAAAAGRANLLATVLGLLRVDASRVQRVNEVEGVTLATLRGESVVRPGQLAATVKVIPYALPETSVKAAEAAAREGGPLLRVDPLPARRVSLLLCAPPAARGRVAAAFEQPLRARVEALGSAMAVTAHLSLEDEAGEAALAEALRREADAGAALILIAGETAIVDRHDIAPRAIERAGGQVEAFGVPVDPGNLLLLAYLGAVPVLCAPGCARSPRYNVVDVVLPRLLAGDRLTRGELLALGHGGLLDDVPERPMPREQPDP